MSFVIRKYVPCLLAALLFALLAPIQAYANIQVGVSVEPESGSIEDEYRLEIRVSSRVGTSPDALGSPQFESDVNFELESIGRNMQQTIVNGNFSSSVIYTYALLPTPGLKIGSYPIPKGYFVHNGKKVFLKRPQIKITGSSSTADPSRQNVVFEHEVSNYSPYVGEQVYYSLKLINSVQMTNIDVPDFELPGVWKESLGKSKAFQGTLGGKSASINLLDEALFPTQAGEIPIPPRTLRAVVHLPSGPKRGRADDPFFRRDPLSGHFSSLFSFSLPHKAAKKRYQTKPLLLNVKPLPPPPAGALDYIPVGDVVLAFSTDKTLLKTDESLTLTVELYGDANLRPFEFSEDYPRSEDFRIYPDKPQIESFIEENKIKHKKSFKFALVPQQTGKLALPQLTVVVFDPRVEKYKTLTTPARDVAVVASGTEQSRVVGPESLLPGSALSQSRKESIKILGTDLLPQHVGPQAAAGKKQFGAFSFILLLVLPPALACVFLFYWTKWAHLVADPKKLAQFHAHKTALGALEECARSSNGDHAAVLGSVLRAYLGDKFLEQGRSLTAQEAESLVLSKTKNHELAKNTRSTLRSLERMQFADKSDINKSKQVSFASDVNDESLLLQRIEQIKTLINGIEDSA